VPFRLAAYFIIAMIGATVVAFWPAYFSSLTTAPWGFHLHGITASLWMLLLAFQSWSIHGGQRRLHRIAGIGSLVLFPFFLAGNVAVVLSMAKATPVNPFYQVYGARLGIMDATTPIILGWLYYHALSERRNIHLHARFMMATPLLLIMPIVSRLATRFIPTLVIHGPEDLHLFAWGVRIANAVAVACAAWLYATSPRFGRPFLVAGLVMLAQAVLFETVALTGAWQSAFAALGRTPMLPILALTVLAAATLSWFGWQAGSRSQRRSA
jgi:hypothetical protein